jgi:5-methylcytosine-specific restriction protein A
MPLRTALELVLQEYKAATSTDFKKNPVAAFLREDLPETVRGVLSNAFGEAADDYLVKGSPGAGNWVKCPWCAILDPVITDSAERGFYPVYLFREDFTGVYLSLNQGVTDVREQYKAAGKKALKSRAVDFRNRLGKDELEGTLPDIDLRPASTGNFSADYQAGNIAGFLYAADALPSNELLVADLVKMLGKYELLISSTANMVGTALEPEEQDNALIEDHSAFRLHRAIERNPRIAKKVKEVHGFNCQACGFSFPETYPGIEKSLYIEAHHLVPVAELKGKKVSRNPKTDFAVLCANCHRMIHRYPEPWDLAGFKTTLKLNSSAVVAD